MFVYFNSQVTLNLRINCPKGRASSLLLPSRTLGLMASSCVVCTTLYYILLQQQ